MRIEVVAEFKVVYVVSDTGYTANMTLPEITKWAKDRLDSVQVLLQEGGLEPKAVRADKRLVKVLFTLEDL